MLIFDELKKNDPQLRLVAMVLAAGLCILLAGLWWVQVVSAHEYQSHLETQAYRTVRLPAIRGKILDREGRVLAENRPRYNLSLYLDDLHDEFQKEYNRLRPVKIATNSPPFWKLWLGSVLVKTNYAPMSKSEVAALTLQARYNVANNLVAQMSRTLQQPLVLDPKNFEHTYANSPYAPYSILSDMSGDQIARFEENFSVGSGVNLDLQPARVYPFGTTAAHLLGYLQRYDESIEGEDAVFNYRLPDYRGLVGIEGGFDAQLHGHAGTESMLINSRGYRQSENIIDPPQSGDNVVLTIDLDIQRAAENAIAAHQGADARAAAIVMDVHTGDVLAMVSSPAINPIYVSNNPAYLNDPKLQPQINRATYGNYAPGSIFKPIVGLAALENGLDPNEIYHVQSDPAEPWHGYIKVGTRTIKDTVPPGDYDFRRAIQQSSNSYFIFNGLRTGIEKIARLAEKFHFGERTGLPTRQESRGIFPTLNQVEDSSSWHAGDSANIFFGQGEMAVTPMQMAVAYSAIANGGKVLKPRLVERIEPQDPTSGEAATDFPSGVVRDEIGVSERSLKILYDAMLSETEDPKGSGYAAFHQAGSVLNIRVCGKTGTAQVENERGQKTGWNYWFASFAPFENPRYAVVVMVQSDVTIGSGGSVCAPIAHDIYEEILKKENAVAAKIVARN
ncbi:MAG TPA: penicillin-binding transpeptidase domain-containing protein [Verrucomicrobiae bacterium]|jgi:penicillin-binding protein 2|nr:penicillin-binding transpeptidase domain-containing protein [Verrucomicrobiae bacterium]